MNKVYTRINWENGEDGNTPLNENNLNKMDAAIDEIDNRVLELANSGSGSGGGSITVDSELSETSENPVQNKVITTKLEEVFQSVSNGKKLIVSALTDKGFDISSDATFEEIADCINSLDRSKMYVQSLTFANEEEAQPYVFSSSWFGSYGRYDWKAFDGNNDTQWCSQSTDNMAGEYIGYNFLEEIYPTYFNVYISNSNGSNPTFVFQALDSNDEWIDLTEIISLSNNGRVTIKREINPTTSYRKYRLYFLAGVQNISQGVDVYEIDIIGYKYE